MSRRQLLLMLGLLLSCSPTTGRAEGPYDDSQLGLEGTWVPDPSRSTSLGPTWRPALLTITRKGPSIGFRSEGTDRAGRPAAMLLVDDGRLHFTSVASTAAPAQWAFHIERSPKRGFAFTVWKFRKVVCRGRMAITSLDGRTMTVASSNTFNDQTFASTLVYTRR